LLKEKDTKKDVKEKIIKYSGYLKMKKNGDKSNIDIRKEVTEKIHEYLTKKDRRLSVSISQGNIK